MTKEYWNEKHTEYYKKSDWADKPTIFSQYVIKYFPKAGKILEIGTGQGRDANFFRSFGYKVVATDFSDIALENAKSKVKSKDIEFVHLDTAQGLPFENESFDVVYSHMALHYFDEETTEKIFVAIHRVLKKDGVFATITNTIEDPEIEEGNYIKLGTDFYKDPVGIAKRYFSVKSIKKFTDSLFGPILLDNMGETYKDKIKTPH